MTDTERLIERLKMQAQQASQVSKTMAEDKSLRQSGNAYLRTDLYMWPQPENTLEGQAATLIQQQADRIAALEGALRGVIDTADSFCDCSGDEVAAQVKIRVRAVLGETTSAEGRG